MGGGRPDACFDVTDQFDRKMRALLCHETQHPDPAGMADRVRTWMGATASAFDLADGRLGEAFRIVDTR